MNEGAPGTGGFYEKGRATGDHQGSRAAYQTGPTEDSGWDSNATLEGAEAVFFGTQEEQEQAAETVANTFGVGLLQRLFDSEYQRGFSEGVNYGRETMGAAPPPPGPPSPPEQENPELVFLRNEFQQAQERVYTIHRQRQTMRHVNVARGMVEAGGDCAAIFGHIIDALEELADRA